MRRSRPVLLTAAMASAALILAAQSPQHDLVITGGRVIEPESGLDAVRTVAINGRTIAAVETGRLEGRRTIDGTGLVVSPGFIDLHRHSQEDENYRHAALDGVTTALELEVGTGDVERWYREREPGRPINYGVGSETIGRIRQHRARSRTLQPPPAPLR